MFSWLKKRKRSDLVCQLYTDKLEGNVDSILQWYAKKNLYSLVFKEKKKDIYYTSVFEWLVTITSFECQFYDITKFVGWKGND